MKLTVAFLAATSLVAVASGTAEADVFPASAVCQAGYGTSLYIWPHMVGGAQTTSRSWVQCGLKPISCTSPPCTYTATITAIDNNYGASSVDTDVMCALQMLTASPGL